MAIIDKKGILHGRVSNIVYRGYRGIQIAQIKPHKVKQTLATKESAIEFGLSASTAFTMRGVFAPVCKGNDGGMANRLTSVVLKSIRSATDKARGERDIHDGDASLFNGFEFNKNSTLYSCLPIRPQVTRSEDGALSLTVPAFGWNDIKEPEGQVFQYIVRFLLVSFDFRKEVYSYISNKDIVISSGKNFAGETFQLAENLPEGRLVMLSMSVHAYKYDHFDGKRSLNSKAWSPASIIAAWQIPGGETLEEILTEKEKGRVWTRPEGDKPFSYKGFELFKSIRELRKNKSGTKKQESKPIAPTPPKLPDNEGEFPKGDIKFKK